MEAIQMKDRATILDKMLEERGLDAYLQFDDSSNSNQLYITGFDASDPMTSAEETTIT